MYSTWAQVGAPLFFALQVTVVCWSSLSTLEEITEIGLSWSSFSVFFFFWVDGCCIIFTFIFGPLMEDILSSKMLMVCITLQVHHAPENGGAANWIFDVVQEYIIFFPILWLCFNSFSPSSFLLCYLNCTYSIEINLVVWDHEQNLVKDLVHVLICRRCKDRKNPADFQLFQMSAALLQDHHG